MPPRLVLVFVLGVAAALCPAPARAADAFDAATAEVLARAAEDGTLAEVKELTAEQLADRESVVPGSNGALLVVRTGEGAYAKLLAQAAGRKGEDGRAVPMLLVERFVTFRDAGGGTRAAGKGVHVFPGFRFHLGIGQVVPEALGGDLLVEPSPGGGRFVVRPAGKAKLYVATKPLPVPAGAKKPAFAPGAKFETRYFNGRYRLSDDGRRSGVLELKVDEASGDVTGRYVSDQNGREYEVYGKAGSPARHAIVFAVKLPQVEETFTGWLFTGDGRAIAGVSKLLDREAGFYAVRIEE